MKDVKNNKTEIPKSNNNVGIEISNSTVKNNKIPLSISLKKDLTFIIYVLAIVLVILLFKGSTKPQGKYTYYKKNHQQIKLTLNNDGTFTRYEAKNADMGEVYYYGTYKKRGILVLKYEKRIINEEDLKKEKHSNIKQIEDNKYEEKIDKTGYAIALGNRLISFSNPKAILKKD